MLNLTKRLTADRRGATAIEYGLVAALICLAILGALTLFAAEAIDIWNLIDAKVTQNN